MGTNHAILLSPLLLAAGCGAAHRPITGRVESQTIASALVGDSYQIDVRLPPDYATSPSRRYPVVYQLDGTSFGPEFSITAGAASGLEAGGTIAPLIVVGIGYPYPDPLVSTTRGRGRDYITTFDDGKPGGAANFLAFVKQELIPSLDRQYRIDPTRRVLSGHSLGGFMSLHELFTTAGTASPPAFWGFIAGDPSLTQDNLRLFDEEAALAARTRSVPAPLWVEIARYDGAVQTLAFKLLRARLVADFPDLRFGAAVRDTDHGGAIAPGFENGLAHIFGGAK